MLAGGIAFDHDIIVKFRLGAARLREVGQKNRPDADGIRFEALETLAARVAETVPGANHERVSGARNRLV